MSIPGTWNTGQGLPVNVVSGYRFTGYLNALTLILSARIEGHGTSHWINSAQLKAAGLYILKGERGTELKSNRAGAHPYKVFHLQQLKTPQVIERKIGPMPRVLLTSTLAESFGVNVSELQWCDGSY